MKVRPVGAELFYAGGRTDRRTDGQSDRTKLTVAFRNFANAPKIDLKGTGRVGVTWIYVTQDRDQWLVLVNVVIKKSGFVKSRDFLELPSNCKVFKQACSTELL
jgi:hypothetical protein